MFKFLMASLVLASSSTLSLAGESRTDIHASAEQAQPLMAGMMAPSFTLQTATGSDYNFDPSDIERPVVLTFFRGGWCPYCNLHLAEMRGTEEKLKEMGFDVWFISLDKPELLVDSLDDPDIGYTLYSDAKIEASREFGIAFRVEDKTVERYKGFGIDLEQTSGENHHVLPVPATFIVGTDGVINFTYANPRYDVRLHPDVLLAAAGAYSQDADKRLKRSP